jgi:hypothetical protein
LNGIVWHPRGFALVVNNDNGVIFKIDAHSPHTVQKVKLGNFFPGADGLLWNNEGDLVLVQNKGVNKIHVIKGVNNWDSAYIKASTATEDRFQHPSTCTIREGKVYVVNSKLNELQDPGITPSKEFSFQLAVFRKM